MRASPAAHVRLPAADVVVVDSLSAWKLVHALRRRRRPPVIALVHQVPGGVDGASWRRRARRVLDLATYRRCDLVVASGPVLAGALRDDGIAPVEVIPPGSDLPLSGTGPPLRDQRRLGVITVANWLPNKGLVELVDAVAGLPHDDVTLHLVGRTDADPSYGAAVTARLQRTGVGGRAVVHGSVDPATLATLYGAADVLVCTSRTEAYGMAVAEALRMGLPVVGWRTPHLCALVEADVEGLLVPPGDTAALGDAIHRLALDPALRASLSEAARRRGARLPTWEQTARRFFDALRGLVTEPVEPSDGGLPAGDIDPADRGVLDEQPAHGELGAERPSDRRLDRTDVRDHDHD